MWVAIGVAVLAVATIVLVILALTQYRTPPASDLTPPSAVVTPSPTPTVTETEAPPPAPPRIVPVPDRLLGAVDANRAYRATAGGCPEPRSTSAVSNDGGATWDGMDISGLTDSSAVLTFATLENSFASVVTLHAETCEPQLARTFVAGINWEVNNENLGSAWYFDPRNPTIVHSPDGDVATPCETVSLAARGDTAAVLCSDERVFASTDRGATWPFTATVTGAAAIAAAGDGFDVAILNQNGCLGVQLVPLTTDLQPGAAGACLAGEIAEGAVAASSGSDGELWVWAGDVVARSGDRGASWR